MPTVAARGAIFAASGGETPPGPDPSDFTESFDKANGALGPDQAWYTATPVALTIVSNAARRGSGSGTGYAFAKQRLGLDGFVQANVTIGTTGTADRGVRLTYRGRLSKYKNAYVALVDYTVAGGTWSARIGKFVYDTFTVLATQSISAPAAGAAVRFEVAGSSLTLKIAGSTVTTATDPSASVTDGDYSGFGINTSSTETAQVIVDSFSAGSTGGAPPDVPQITSLPTTWTKSPSNPLVEVADLSGIDDDPDIGYATVIYAAGRLALPINTLYMWCAPHGGDSALGEPGNIFLLTAPAPEGPWTAANSGNPVITTAAVPAYNQHLSSPYVLWNPGTAELWLWAHVARNGGGGSQQPTMFFKSTNGINWTIQNSGNPVLLYGAAGTFDDSHAAYMRVYHDGTQLVGFYQASNIHQVHPPEDVRIARATSLDGVTWTKTGTQPVWYPQDSGDDQHSPLPVSVDDGVTVFYASVNRPSGLVELFRRDQPTGDARWSDPYPAGVPVGGSGAFDSAKVAVNELIYDGTKFWLFYHGAVAIGTASAVGDQVGFDTAWGKGPLPVDPPATSFTESFDKDDGPLGPDLAWANIGDVTTSTVVSNAAQASVNDHGTGISAAIATDAAVGPDFDVSGSFTITPSTVNSVRGVSLFGRMVNSATLNGYRAMVFWSFGQQAYRFNITRFVAGVSSTVQGDVTLSPAVSGSAPRTFSARFTGVGSTLTLYVDGTQVWTATDSAVTTGDYAGFGIRHSSTSSLAHVILDNWAVQPATPSGSSGMSLVLDENFTGTAVDTTKWHIEDSAYGSPPRLQRYRPGNVTVANDELKLQVKRESFGGMAFTAGMISTRDLGLYYPRFGRYQFRAKLPHGHGLWPAFWLRHRSGSNVCEVDIMEYFHGQIPARTSGVLHREPSQGAGTSYNVSNRNKYFEDVTYTPGWHTWAVEIVPEGDDVRFRWFVDDECFGNYLDTSATYWSGLHPGQGLFDITIQGTQVGGSDPDYVGHPDGELALGDDCLISGTPGSCTTTLLGHTVQRAGAPHVSDPDGAAGAATLGGVESAVILDHVRVWEWASGNGSPLEITENFTGYPNGTAIGTSSTVFQAVTMATGRTIEFNNDRALVTHGGSPGSMRLERTAGLGRTAYRQEIKLNISDLSNDDEFCMWQEGSTRLAMALVRADGAVRCYHGSSATDFVESAAGVVTAGTPFRLEIYHDTNTGATELRVWSTADDTGPATATLVAPVGTATGLATRIAPLWHSIGTAGMVEAWDFKLYNTYWD